MMSPPFCRERKPKLLYVVAKKYRLLSLLACCILCFVATALLYVQHSPPAGDEPHYLIISQTLLKYHSLDVALDYQHGDYYTFYHSPLQTHLAHNIRGQALPVQNIGAPILWLLPFLLLGRLGSILCITLVSVFIIYNIYKLLLVLGFAEHYALIVSAAYMLGSPLYLYSHLVFVEPIGALACIFVVRKLFQQKIILHDLLVCSLLLGILPWVHIRFALFEIVLFFPLLYKVYRQYALKNMLVYLAYLGPVSLLFVALEIYNFVIWGTLNPAANQISDNSVPFQVSPLRGLVGTFFDQQYGLLLAFPLFLFLFLGIVLTLKKRYWRYNACMLALSLPYLLLVNSFSIWSGGWSPPARFIVALLPLYSFYIAYALVHMKSVFVSLVFALTTGYGLFYNLRTLFAFGFGFNGETGQNRTLSSFYLFNQPVTTYLPSLYLPHQEVLLTAWIGGTVLLCVVLLLMGRRRV